jgi:integrase
LAANSIRAYDADLRAFLSTGGTLPATPDAVAAHLASQAGFRTPATLARRLVAIGKAHLVLGLPNPCDAEIVRATLRGIRRTHGIAQRQAEPLLREDLMCLLPLFAESAKGVRDRALLLLGFAGALRRSELASIRFEDLRFVAEGLVLRDRKSVV